jgi:Na+/proline symporter
MSRRERWTALVIGIPGALFCLGAVAVFVGRVVTNDLAKMPRIPSTEYYLAVGDAYSGGFATGFFLCLSLVLVAVAIAAWVEVRRSPRNVPAPGRPVPEGGRD